MRLLLVGSSKCWNAAVLPNQLPYGDVCCFDPKRKNRESGWTRPKQKATTTPFTQVCHLGVKRMIVFFSTHPKKTICDWVYHMTRVAEKKTNWVSRTGRRRCCRNLADSTGHSESRGSWVTWDSKNHWVQLSFSGFPWFSPLKIAWGIPRFLQDQHHMQISLPKQNCQPF